MGQGSWDAEKMLELGRRHAEIEARRDLDALMATLVADPVYEFHPLGLTLRGGEAVRRYYAQFFENFMAHIERYELVDEWVNERSVVQEYEITLRFDGVLETHRTIGILFAEGELLGGERIYGDEALVRRMAGMLFHELKPL
jgi:hypothetical protein